MHHVFSVEIATQYGVNAAIILQNLEYWIEHNRANDKHYYEGRYWTYSSVRALEELFPYLSGRQISTALQKLLDDGILVRGRFNRSGFDRTLWYALTEKGEALLGHKPVERMTREPEPEEEEAENPFGEYEGHGIPDTVETYAAKNLDRMTPGNMQEFATYKGQLPEELIRHAIDEACGGGVRAWNYVRRILDRYISSGFTSLAQVKAREEATDRMKRKQEQDDNPLLKTKFY